jgi:integrase
MATIRTIIKGKSNPLTIYLRLVHGRSIDITKTTNINILTNDWSNKAKEPKRTTEQGKAIKIKLDKLKTAILERFNIAVENGTTTNGVWLQNQIDEIQNRTSKDEEEKGDLLTFLESYIEYLPNHIQASGKRGVSKNTIQKFQTLKARITDLQKAKKQKYKITDINPDFIQLFDGYLRKKSYSDNYIGTLSTNLKTVCKHARKKGFKVSNLLDDIKAVKENSVNITLSFAELKKIKDKSYKREALSNARDWLVIGCYLGQRVSDLLRLTSNNIVTKGGLLMIELIQQKTGNKIILPINDEVKTVLDKRDGEFPYKISNVKFNLYIKDVCKIANITQPTQGAKMNPKTMRKEKGIYPKYELVTSHICRRSFATNYYGDIPTPLLMSATGHTTEKKFLIYIGKTATEQAQQLAEYWAKLASENKKEPVMNVIKKLG